MISVIIPLYNKDKFITKTIQSVLNQTFTDFELLIVNDGSTDNSLKIAQSFNDKRLKLISIENSGVSLARNTGIKAAKHNWIALLDADDWWAPTFLEEFIEAFKLFPNYNLFVVGRSRFFK
ncbi:MAG: glycosyltransferase family 2 protein, partial [Bacteroidetes bacterium]|nr:glycosyltransferase family 2 protein [Bacteroidota bacterium]